MSLYLVPGIHADDSQGYLAVLGFMHVLLRDPLGGRAYNHASWLLFLLWSVYMYRDVWPLATVNLVPADKAEGPLLWAKLALLSVTGVIVPVVIPKKYTPLDPKVSGTFNYLPTRHLTWIYRL